MQKENKKMHTQRRYATCFGMSKKKEEEKMHTQRMYATCLGMSKKKKDSPLSKKREMVHTKEFIHHPPKNIHILAHLDQGL